MAHCPSTAGSRPVDIPQGFTQFTIGNRAKYRDYAMDLLIPGRFETDKNNTADQDWYIRYVQGGGMKQALERAPASPANPPRSRASTAADLNQCHPWGMSRLIGHRCFCCVVGASNGGQSSSQHFIGLRPYECQWWSDHLEYHRQ